MSGMGRVSRTHRLSTTVQNCTRDEGGPFEVGSQVRVSSHRKLLSSRAMVVSVAETSGPDPGRQGLREASASEPPMKCRKRIRRCQNRGVTLPPGSARENPEACPSGIRHAGGAKLNQALVRNVRTCRSDAKGEVPAAHTARTRVPKRSTGAEQLVVCAGQRSDWEGSSPSSARMRSAVSKSGGNASLAEARGRYGAA